MSQRANVSGSRTNIGCVREQNEDALVVQRPLYAVADGMGGHAAGEVASEMAVDILAENAPSIRDGEALIKTIRIINRAIIDATRTGQGRVGMGTTLTAAILDGPRLLIAQVGDSRAYLLHKNKLQQLTRDHSYVAELLAGGHITADEALAHPKRSVITRALGSDPKTEADIYELEATVGDRLLLCTDGLYGMVPLADLTRILDTVADPQDTCDALVAAAREAGGLDNISVIVVDIHEEASEFLSFTTEARESEGAAGRQGRQSRSRSAAEANKGFFKRFHLGILTFLILLALLVGGAIGGVYWYASNSAFLRAEDGRVVVYRGLPGEVLPGLRLEWYEYTTDIKTSDLLTVTAERLSDGVRVDSLNDAATLVADYERQIKDNAPPGSRPS